MKTLSSIVIPSQLQLQERIINNLISRRTKTFLTEVYDSQSDPGGEILVPEMSADTGAPADDESRFIRSASISVVDRGKNLAMVTFSSTNHEGHEDHEDAVPAVNANDNCQLPPLHSEGRKVKLLTEVEETSKHRRVLR
jgi:hypothetical protein